jgi:hypothetical protein
MAFSSELTTHFQGCGNQSIGLKSAKSMAYRSISGLYKDLKMRQRKVTVPKGATAPLQLVDPRQAAILLLWRIELRDKDRHNPTTRAQFTVPMLRRLWNRPRLLPEFLEDVSAWLAVAGWCFFNAGATYAAVRISAVKNWPRLGTSKIKKELNEVANGKFPFEDHERLLSDSTAEDSKTSEGDDTDEKISNDED